MGRSYRVLVLLFVLCACVATSKRDLGDKPSTERMVDGGSDSILVQRVLPVPSIRPGQALDLQVVMDRVRVGYRREGRDMVSATGTYSVRVSGETAAITPYHDLRSAEGQPEAALVGAPMELTTRAVTRGELDLFAGQPIETRVSDDGALEFVRNGVLERLRSGGEGLEQTWTFERLPAGSGDLSVHVQVAGQRFRGISAGGLHFVGDKSQLGFRYGHGTWIDAHGRKTRVEARWENEAIALRVPAGVLADSVYPAVLDPIVGPEMEIDEPVRAGGSDTHQERPDLAWNGTQWLVVWCGVHAGSRNIYGARVNPDGSVADPAAIVISDAPFGQVTPRVSWDGTQWLVVWSDSRKGTVDADIYGARVQANGAVTDSNGLAIATASARQHDPRVSWGGAEWLVTWNEGNELRAVRVTTDGAVVSGSLMVVGSDTGQVGIAASGAQWLVVWSDYAADEVRGVRINPDGSLADPSPIVVAEGRASYSAEVSWNGTHWLVVWASNGGRGYNDNIYGARVGTNGAVLDATPIALPSDDFAEERLPTVASDGSSWMVVWQAEPLSGNSGVADVRAARIAANGATLDAVSRPVATGLGPHQWAQIAWGGSAWLVVFEDARWGQQAIYGARVDASGSAIDPAGFAITTRASTQQNVAAAWNGAHWLVIWEDARNGTSTDIYGVRVKPDGEVVDGSVLLLGAAAHDQRRPRVSASGTDWLVVWEDYRSLGGDRPSVYRSDESFADIYGTRVSANGTVLDGAGIVIASDDEHHQGNPRIASGDAGWMVVWEDARTDASDVYGARVSAAGAVLDSSSIAIATGEESQSEPSISWNGTHWLVVWQDSSLSAAPQLKGARLSASGSVVDSGGISISSAEGSGGYRASTGISWNGSQWLATWLVGNPADVYAIRVNPNGTVADPTPVQVTATDTPEYGPDVAWNGYHWLVVWADDAAVRGARVDPLATVDAQSSELAPWAPHVALTGGPPRQWFLTSTVRDEARARLVESSDETCDGVDDDSDGQKDEDYVPVPTSTVCGVGACARTGMTTCTDGAVVDAPCVPGAPPEASDSDCDGEDDDCSGQADEDYVPEPVACGIGVCRGTGQTSCEGGFEGYECTESGPTASDDTTCNNVDEDCSGEADEDYVSVVTPCGRGVCASVGTSTCAGGVVGSTCVPGAPSSGLDDTCDNLDQDCDGSADEDYVGITTHCGVGACRATASATCVGGNVVDHCTPGPPASASDTTCNGIDEDCSGMADEDYAGTSTSCGRGVCRAEGATRCEGGAVVNSCAPAAPTSAVDNTCDGLDDDCDGTTDEDAPCSGMDGGNQDANAGQPSEPEKSGGGSGGCTALAGGPRHTMTGLLFLTVAMVVRRRRRAAEVGTVAAQP